MSGPISSNSFAKALWPGINAWWGKAYDEHEEEFPHLFDTYTSDKAYEEDVGISSFGLAPVKPEGSGIQYDKEIQGYVTRYSHVTYALGFIITREIYDDDLYDVVGQRRAEGLAFSGRQTKENVAANVYNRAFDDDFAGADGVSMISTEHPNVAGGTFSNRLETDADLSEAALEQAMIDIMNYKNDRGLRISAMARKLIVPPDLAFEAERILNTPYRVGTANNDINAMSAMGKLPEGFTVNHYFTDPNAWFLRTNIPHGMKHFQRRQPEFTIDNDFDTENAKFKFSERYSFGWTDPRGVFGSAGS